MALTPMQEIFILLENEKEVPLYRLNRWGKKARGALAKLKKQALIEKHTKDNETYYRITAKGEKEFDQTLKPLKAIGSWDGRWRLVLFDIPETKRDVRDRLRRALSKLGLGILQASVWITPNDIKTEIDQISQRLNLVEAIKYFEVSRNKALDKKIIEKSWNLPELSDLYRRFNLEAERFLKINRHLPNHKYSIKKLIYEYALIMQKDPIMPQEFRQKDVLRKKAHQNYLDLRKLLY